MRDDPPSGELLDGALARYAAGESDRDERTRVEAWAAASVERSEYLSVLRRSWVQGRTGATDAELRETDAAWAALRARLTGVETTPWVGKGGGHLGARSAAGIAHRPALFIPGSVHTSRRRLILRGAAAALVLAAGGAGALHYYSSVRESARPSRQPVVAVGQSPMREVVTGIGERTRIRLGDGSTIVLAARSRLGIPADFGVRTRELEAEGEAYFAVAHDSTLPFIVHARGARTVDLGTAFVVRAYPDDPHVTVVVTEGSVALGADPPGDSSTPVPKPTTLRRGQLGRLVAGTRVPVVTAVDPDSYTGWMDGRLAFDNAPLPEVVAELGRWHHVEISLADSSLARETVTATLTAESFQDALQTLTTVLTLRAERSGNRVVLHRRGGRR